MLFIFFSTVYCRGELWGIKAKPIPTKDVIPTKIIDILVALFENVRFMKQIVSLFFMKAFYLEVLQKILARNLIIFFTFLDSYYIKIYYEMQTHNI